MSGAALTARMGGSILHPNAATLGKITDAGPVSDTVIQINELSVTLLATQESSLSALEMRHPRTPDSRPLICMGKEQNYQRHDSNGQIGPFFNTIYVEAPQNVGNKEEVGIGDPKQATDIPP